MAKKVYFTLKAYVEIDAENDEEAMEMFNELADEEGSAIIQRSSGSEIEYDFCEDMEEAIEMDETDE